MFQAVADAHLAHSGKVGVSHKTTVLSISHSLDVQPLLNDSLSHQTSCKRYLIERLPENYSLIDFGLEGRRVASQDLAYLEGKVEQHRRRAFWLSEIKREGALVLWANLLDKLV